MVAAHRDPSVRSWWRNRATTTEEALRIIHARQASTRAGTGFGFAVLLVDDDCTPGDLVGGLNLRQLGDESVCGEVGYWVAASARGRGIAPRALNAACEWVFRLPRPRTLERLELIHAVGNVAFIFVREIVVLNRFSGVKSDRLAYKDAPSTHSRLGCG
jgi:RimJ/RimL family protein N-acetyltransferase